MKRFTHCLDVRRLVVSSLCVMTLIFLQACLNSNGGADSCLFTLTNTNAPMANEVLAYARDTETGMLTMVGRFATGGFGNEGIGGLTQNSLAFSGRHLYAVNPGPQPEFASTANEGQGSITVFLVQDDCMLEQRGVVPSGGMLPASLALRNDLLYAANQGNVPFEREFLPASYSGFRILNDGTLTPIENSTVVLEPIEPEGNNPADLLFNADGTMLVGIRISANEIDTFSVDADGRLTNRQIFPTGGGPFGSAFSPTDPSLLLVSHVDEELNDPAVPELSRAPGLVSFRLETDGKLMPLDEVVVAIADDPNFVDPCWTAVTSDSHFIWTSSLIPRTLNLFAIGDNGELTRTSVFNPMDVDEETGAVLGSVDITVSPDDRFFYQLRAFDPDGEEELLARIDVHRLTGDSAINAGLELIQSVPQPADQRDTGSMGLVVMDL